MMQCERFLGRFKKNIFCSLVNILDALHGQDLISFSGYWFIYTSQYIVDHYSIAIPSWRKKQEGLGY